MTPVRIQLRRTKGWKMPPNTVNVARPGRFGNPFSVTTKMAPGTIINHGFYVAVPTVADAIECFRESIAIDPKFQAMIHEELRGKNLACFCKLSEPCHADVLLEIANAPSSVEER